MKTTTGDLQKIKVFSNLSQHSLDEILAVALQTSHVNEEIILTELQQNAPVMCVTQGAVRIFRTNLEGREQTLMTLHAGDVFNLPAVFLENNKSPASASAMGECNILGIPADEFRSLVIKNPEISLAVLKDLSAKLEHLTDLVFDVSLRSVRGRLAKFLLDPSHKLPGAMRWTHEQMASRLGTTREVISRMIGAFVQEGLVTTVRHRIVVVDAEKLNAFIE